MEEKKIKKKLTLSALSKKTYRTPYYAKSGRKTSVVIEKKKVRKWGEKKFQPQGHNFDKTKPFNSEFLGSWKFHLNSWRDGCPKMPRIIIKYEERE